MKKLSIAAVTVLAGLVLRGQTAKSAKVDFDRHIRPILSNNCFTCHGPDEKARMANLRLDDKESALRMVVPGKRNESKLFQRVSHADVNRRMPPPGTDRKVTPEQIELIGKWIDEGAQWQTHWSYSPPRRPEAPVTRNKTWAKNGIDAFILSKLEAEGLKPSPEADRSALLRRVTLDLTGLPPAPAEVQAFASDKSPDAYEKVVDRLLASPHYGERMAMQWLDLARYADTHGYHIDSHRDMWPWRDWVIKAYNANMPYDKFTLEQLAGDMLPNPTREQRLATGFNRNHMINYEGGAIPDEYLVEYNVDRVETTSVVWMGMTMGCARCHDHKYDPISQRDFYRFFAFFYNVDEKGLDGKDGNAKPFLPLPDSLQDARMKEIETAIETRTKAMPETEVDAALAEWAKTAAPSNGPAQALAHYELDGVFSDVSGAYHHARVKKGTPTFAPGPAGQGLTFDGESQVDWGTFGQFDQFTVALWLRSNNKLTQTVLQKGTQRGVFLRLEEASSIGEMKRGARLHVRMGQRESGDALEVRTRRHLVQSEFTHVAITHDASGLRVYLDGKPAEVDVLANDLKSSTPSDGAWSSMGLRATLDDLRFYGRVLDANEIHQIAVDAPSRASLYLPAAKRSRDQREKLRDYYLTYAAPETQQTVYSELKQLRADKARLEKEVVTTMVMDDLEKPREAFILARGDYRNKTEKVSAAVPASLPPLPPGVAANRLGLAKWLMDPSHPLTARVAVNRYWQLYFGNGIVETSEDFGSQGAPPSHPELLDWLATEFIRTGWDVKAMQKLIVTSATYRQSSQSRPELIEKDPGNRLLAHMSRFRLPAETVRDNALAISGLLNSEIGGRSVYPYQPAGLWEEMAYGDVFTAQAYVPSKGKDLYRRSMYTFWKRTVPPAQMSTFDAPDREKCVARRARTNTPLQALVLMNDPTYVEAARVLAEKVIREGGRDAASRIRIAFRLAAARVPTSQEVKLLSDLAAKQQAAYGRNPADAGKLLSVGDSKAAGTANRAELAAWTLVADAILNLDEVITRE